MVKIKNWVFHGINIIQSDSVFKELEKYVASENISEATVQKATGIRTAINVDHKKHVVTFYPF